MLVVIALGGNALLRRGDPLDADVQRRNVQVAAAAVAAWHSRKRESKQVAVSCTRARYVTKPRGAKPGTVEIRKDKVLKVRPAIPEDG